MQKIILPLLFLSLLSYSNKSFAQAPDLGASAMFALFTASGAFNGDAATSVVGDIGTDVGAFTPPGFLVGQIHIADPVSAQAASDVSIAYSYLSGLTCNSVLTTPLGNSQILLPDIYCIGTAAVLNADLILDGGGDPGAIFIFQINGALSTNPFSNILLTNGANLCNVYWQINGALNMGGNTLFQGTVIAEGAINLANGATLNGRGLSTAGAISTSANVVSLPNGCLCTLDVICPNPVGGTFSCVSSIPAGTAADVTVNTACGTTTVNIAETSTGLGCSASPFVLTRTYTVEDNGGHVATCSVAYTVIDNVLPIITCPTVTATIACPAIPTFPTATATDLCGATPAITFLDATTPGNCPQAYSVTRTWTATDACGNSAQCSQTIAVTDNLAPIIVCPTAPASIECTAVPNFPAATATDLCDPMPVITFLDATTPGVCPQPFSTTRTWTATDACGNSAQCSQTIALTDLLPPSIVCPTVTASIACPAIPTFPSATATDLCDPMPSITFLDASTPGNCPQTYSVTRTWTATDACGNTAQCSQTIVVIDNVAPIIVCPIVTATIACPAIPTFPSATATDLCDPMPSITFLDASTPGTCPQTYSVTRTWTATDACGNSAQCSQTIAVTDNSAPIIVCPTVTATIACPAIPTFPSATATDLCDLAPVITFLDASTPGNCPQAYSVTRTWTATDACGNTAQCNQTIAVIDNSAPIIVCPTVTATIACPAIPTFPSATATDLCDLAPVITFLDATTAGNCPQAYSVTRTWTATDACGNTAQCNRTIAVTDLVAPVFVNPPANIMVECNAVPPIAILPVATDACAGPVPVILLSEIQTPGICPTVYTLTRIWRATDNCGNSATTSQVLTVLDTQAPIFIQNPTDVSLECNLATNPDAFQDWLDTQGGSIISDCSTVTWTYANSPVFIMPSECGGTSMRVIRFMATDECGNTAFRDASFRIQDLTPPKFDVLPQNLNVECIAGDQGEGLFFDWFNNFGFAEVSDDCGTVTKEIAFISKQQLCGNTFRSTYQFRATDECGNTNFVTATFAVVDTTPPVIITCPPSNVLLTCEFSIPAPDTAGVVAFDECGLVTVSLLSTFSVGVGCVYYPLTKSYTYAVTDACGNVSTCYQSFQVVDSIPPIYTGPDTISVICVADLPGIGEIAGILAPYFSDNCYDIICVNEGVALSGQNWITYCIKAKDLCVNWTEKFFVTFIVTGGCKPLCTAPQAVWGDPNAEINGLSSTETIEQLIGKYGALKAGKLGKTISIDQAACVQTMLPGNGSTVQFAPGNHVFGADNQCNTSSPLLNANGTLNHQLAANVLAMQLNIWYNQAFNERDLGVQSMASLPPCLVDILVVNKLEENHSNVQGLLNLSNDYLAGVGFFPPNFGQPLNNALDNLNHYWQNCQVTDPCFSSATLAGHLKTEGLDALEEVDIHLDGLSQAGSVLSMNQLTDGAGLYQFNDALPMLSRYTLTPNSAGMGYLNGVSTYDIALISRHINGWEPLNSPYKMIAADVNQSGSITTFDILELRKLVLGVYDQLPENTSWRFVDQSYIFPEVNNPFFAVFPEFKSQESVQASQMAENFVGVKIGDVNGSAYTNGLRVTDARNENSLWFDLADRQVQAGEIFTVKMTASQVVQGYQFTLNTDGLDVLEVEGEGLTAGNFAVYPALSAMTSSWNQSENVENQPLVFSLTLRAIRSGTLSNMLGVSSRITPSEAYSTLQTGQTEVLEVALRYQTLDGVSISGVDFELYQNEPNPFVDKTRIGFYLPEASPATLKIFDESGRFILTQTADFAKGYHVFEIHQQLLPTGGVLMYTLSTPTHVATRKMIQAK